MTSPVTTSSENFDSFGLTDQVPATNPTLMTVTTKYTRGHTTVAVQLGGESPILSHVLLSLRQRWVNRL